MQESGSRSAQKSAIVKLLYDHAKVQDGSITKRVLPVKRLKRMITEQKYREKNTGRCEMKGGCNGSSKKEIIITKGHGLRPKT